MIATVAKVKLKIKRCSEWRGTRAGTFYTGTRGETMLWSQFFSSNITMTLTSTKSLPEASSKPKSAGMKWPGTELVRRRWKKTRVVPGLGKTSISSRWQLTMMVILNIRSLIPLIPDDFLLFDFQSWYSSQGSQCPKYSGDQSRLGCSCLSTTGTWTFLEDEEKINIIDNINLISPKFDQEKNVNMNFDLIWCQHLME